MSDTIVNMVRSVAIDEICIKGEILNSFIAQIRSVYAHCVTHHAPEVHAC